MGETKPAVSIIVPCRNERQYIEKCVHNILAQEPPPGGFELIISDGMSDDGTRNALKKLESEHPQVRVIDNVGKTAACGLNAALRTAHGDIIIRMDAHTRYAPDYVRQCVLVLEETGADNVGGPWIAEGQGLISGAIAAAFQSPFAVGGGRAHNPCYEGELDTVYLGCWRREVFDRIGFFDEQLVRNQDDEFNLRLSRAGGRIWQSPKIKSWYTPRNSLKDLFRQCVQDGYWKVGVIQKHTLPASVRHVVPGAFLISLAVLPLMSLWWPMMSGLWLGLLGLYLTTSVSAALLAAKTSGWTLFPGIAAAFSCYHFGYGYGFLRGVVDFFVSNREPNENFIKLTRPSVSAANSHISVGEIKSQNYNEANEMITCVLGIHDGHNASAALIEKGKVVAAVQEERLTGQKNQGGIPRRAMGDVLVSSGVAIADVQKLALNGSYMTYDHWEHEALLGTYEPCGWVSHLKQPLKQTIVDKIYQNGKAQHRASQFADLGFDNGILAPVVHHTAHAAAAYYGSGWQGRVLVLTCDGGGDRLSATVNIGENGRLERIGVISENDSIGKLYSMVTFHLGMLPLEHEYKVMGLAPYVNDLRKVKEKARLFSELFEFDPKKPLTWRRRPGIPPMFSASEFIRNLLYRQRFDLIAAGLQQFTEEMLTQWVRNCVRETGIRRVACGGGVFMNIKANKEILAMPEVEDLFVFPSCGDEMNSIGAAFWVYAQECLKANRPVDIEPIGPIYWGRDFDDSEVQDALRDFKGQSRIRHEFVENIEQRTADSIARGEVVARAKGRMEFGARALGNRSILARADNAQAVRVINDMVKNRDFWMPFAPAVLAERAEDYYIKPKPMPAPYMTVGFDSRPETRHKTSACQHPYDYSLRPQEVTESSNPDFYHLLKHYEEITGEGIVLNTSFNLHGYPIAYAPGEALDILDRSGLRYLALGNWWVEKQ